MNKSEVIEAAEKLEMDEITTSRHGNIYEYEDRRTKLINGVPHVYPAAETKRMVFIVCPYCKSFHSHGKAGKEKSGERMSHCKGSSKPYIIEKKYRRGLIVCRTNSK